MATQFNLKTATPDTSFPSGGFLFGADSQSASDPSIYSSDAYLNYLVTVASAWSAAQTFTSAAPQLTLGVNATTLGSIKLFGNTSGDATLRPTAAAGTATICTLPATTTTLAGLAVVQTFSAANTFTSAAPQLTLGVNTTTLGSIKMFGDTSGDVTLRPTAAAGTATTLTLPATTSTLAGLAIAQTFTTTQTITPSTEVSPLVLTGGTLAGTTSRPLISATQTWNNSGLTATGILLNITDTSSNAASLLMDFQLGGTSYFRFQKNAFLSFVNTSGGFNGFRFQQAGVDRATVAQNSGGDVIVSNFNGSGVYQVDIARFLNSSGVLQISGNGLGWGATGGGSTTDILFVRLAAGILSFRGTSSTTPAAFNFYTYGASPPSAPSASMALLYSDTSGGKIRLMALFPSGAAQQIAIEP